VSYTSGRRVSTARLDRYSQRKKEDGMGGAGISPSGKAGRKALDASINLVPFIDLLSCCISFLLITAVWTQLSAVDVTNPRSQGSGQEPPPKEVVQLTLHLLPDGYLLQRSTGEQVHIDRSGSELNFAQLSRAVRDVKTLYPEKRDITMRASDQVVYDEVIRTLDVLRGDGFPDVQVSDQPSGS
jgi:biopolymer transport protein TolR